MTKTELVTTATEWLRNNVEADKIYDVDDVSETFSELQEFMEETLEDSNDE
tara:strand:+ start:3585 stop:3737 length:153 start_codon:yes stop_codon:yes gene_type:complete